jgi:hypothetical protein
VNSTRRIIATTACYVCHHRDDEEQDEDDLSHRSNPTNVAQRLRHGINLFLAVILGRPEAMWIGL